MAAIFFTVSLKAWYNDAMNKKTPNQPYPVYVLRVNIKDIEPQIWRELSVPADYTLGDLHDVLQIAFGWDDDHLHSFTVNSVEYGMADLDFKYDDEDMPDEDSVCLYDLNLHSRQKFRYLYDFGDCWEHEIRVSKIISTGAKDEDLIWPHCLGGERAAPLEDTGGVWGYGSMLEALKDPAHKEYEDIHEWAGDFDPEYFNLEELNASLEEAFKPRS
jgi:hypothetical protein